MQEFRGLPRPSNAFQGLPSPVRRSLQGLPRPSKGRTSKAFQGPSALQVCSEGSCESFKAFQGLHSPVIRSFQGLPRLSRGRSSKVLRSLLEGFGRLLQKIRRSREGLPRSFQASWKVLGGSCKVLVEGLESPSKPLESSGALVLDGSCKVLLKGLERPWTALEGPGTLATGLARVPRPSKAFTSSSEGASKAFPAPSEGASKAFQGLRRGFQGLPRSKGHARIPIPSKAFTAPSEGASKAVQGLCKSSKAFQGLHSPVRRSFQGLPRPSNGASKAFQGPRALQVLQKDLAGVPRPSKAFTAKASPALRRDFQGMFGLRFSSPVALARAVRSANLLYMRPSLCFIRSRRALVLAETTLAASPEVATSQLAPCDTTSCSFLS